MNTKKIQGNQHVVSRKRPDPFPLVHRRSSACDKPVQGAPGGKAGGRAAQGQGSLAGTSPPSSPTQPSHWQVWAPHTPVPGEPEINTHPSTYGAIIMYQLIPKTMDNFPGCVACPMALPLPLLTSSSPSSEVVSINSYIYVHYQEKLGGKSNQFCIRAYHLNKELQRIMVRCLWQQNIKLSKWKLESR